MTWGAHKTDVRIAAKNSVQVRAALRVSINAEKIYEAYQDTHPYVSDNITQDRARARAWAMLHVKIDNAPIEAALKKVYTDGFLLGLDASQEAIKQAEKKYNKGAEIIKAEESDYVDWANWKPGNRAAALLYRPTGAFEKILANAGIVSKNIAKAGYDRIGTALADSIAAGFSPGRAAKIIALKVSDPARALTIAVTEQNRAMSLASMQNYKNYGVEKVEWSGANPCDLCAPNEGQMVALGEQFESGDTEPPVHPNCRCALLPVINEEFDAEPDSNGLNTVPMQEIAPTEQAAPKELTGLDQFNSIFDEGKYKTLNREQQDTYSRFQLENKKFMNALGNPEPSFPGDKGFNRSSGNEAYQMLRDYKSTAYETLNYSLRTGETGNFLTKEMLNEQVNAMEKAMRAAPGSTKDFLTFRGINGIRDSKITDFFNDLNKGDVFSDKGYSSTSMKMEFAHKWKGSADSWLLEIENPKGTKGIMLDGLTSGTAGREAEWLLPKDSKFQIISKDDKARIMRVRVIQ
jgi:hypothetical protein